MMSDEADRASHLKEAPEDLRDASDDRALPTDAEVPYPSGFKLASVIISLLLAVFCVALDNTVRPAGLPSPLRSSNYDLDHRDRHTPHHR